MKNLGLALLASLLSLNTWAANKPAAHPDPAPAAQKAPQAAPSPVMVTMGQELDREMPILSRSTPPAYFISYILTSSDRSEVMGSNGALLSSEESHSRWLETQVRVGSYPSLDNTHKVGNSAPGQGSFGASVPIDNAPDVLRRAMWLTTDKQFRTASEALIKINTSKEVQVQTAEGTRSGFCSANSRIVSYGAEVSGVHPDRKPWEEKVRVYTRAFRESPQILNSIVTFDATGDNSHYQVTSEGTKLQFRQVHFRLELFIQGKAPDGMAINRYYNFGWANQPTRPKIRPCWRREQSSAQGTRSAGGRAAG